MLHLTPAMLEAAYELLRTTPPFRNWRLPEPDDIAFHVSRSRTEAASLRLAVGKPPVIEVSSRSCSTLMPVVRAMAHEMVHLHEHLSGDMRADCMHGKAYRRRAKRVCAIHLFDPMQFGGLE